MAVSEIMQNYQLGLKRAEMGSGIIIRQNICIQTKAYSWVQIPAIVVKMLSACHPRPGTRVMEHQLGVRRECEWVKKSLLWS